MLWAKLIILLDQSGVQNNIKSPKSFDEMVG